MKNIREVLGANWYRWLLPQSMSSDGLKFPVYQAPGRSSQEGNAVNYPNHHTLSPEAALIEVTFYDMLNEATSQRPVYDSDDDFDV